MSATVMNSLRGCRPFPVDKDRQKRCHAVLSNYGMTQTELAIHLGCSKQLISSVISGKQLSKSAETRIAQFFGLPRTAMFPLRTAEEIARMRAAEAAEKAEILALKAGRMKLREEALAKSGAA